MSEAWHCRPGVCGAGSSWLLGCWRGSRRPGGVHRAALRQPCLARTACLLPCLRPTRGPPATHSPPAARHPACHVPPACPGLPCPFCRCRERDRLYERAEKVASLLSHLGDQLKEAIADVNDSTGGWVGGRVGAVTGSNAAVDDLRRCRAVCCARQAKPLAPAQFQAQHAQPAHATACPPSMPRPQPRAWATRRRRWARRCAS